MLVNNAGIGLMGAFEATPMATVREVFETNTFGVMAMTQAVLPQFRARRSGVVVNVTSSATLAPMPMVAAYTASKMAIEGFTAALSLELQAFNVSVKEVRYIGDLGSKIPGCLPGARATETLSPPGNPTIGPSMEATDGLERHGEQSPAAEGDHA